MSNISKPKQGMVLCINKATGKTKYYPESLFRDPAIASTLDIVKVDVKKFDDFEEVKSTELSNTPSAEADENTVTKTKRKINHQ